MSTTIHRFSFPTDIHFGPNAIEDLPALLKSNGLKKVLIVTDKGIAELPFLKKIETLAKKSSKVTIYSEISGNPVLKHVTDGTKVAKEKKVDCVIAIGGGAALDVGKVIALMTHHTGKLFDYEDGKPKSKPMNKQMPFIIGIPTTAGTGSEVGRSSVISDDKTHQKKIIFGPALLPKIVIADPMLTVELPPNITAATGMDALTHLVEAYVAKGWHPMCDGIALEGFKLVTKSLEKAVRDGKNIEARSNMLMASMMGAVAFQKGLGVTHSCAHSLSTHCDTHHGLANGVMIPYAMSFNRPVAKERFDTLAKIAGHKDFVQWLFEFQERVEVPSKLSDLGVEATKFDSLVETALADGCHQLNPREVTKENFEEIFQSAH